MKYNCALSYLDTEELLLGGMTSEKMTKRKRDATYSISTRLQGIFTEAGK